MDTITTLEDFESNLIKHDIMLVIAKTHSCATCQIINAHLLRTIPMLDKIPHYQLFVDDVEAFRGKYVVFSVPTVLIFAKEKEILRESRFIDTHKINRLLENYLQ